MGMITIGGVEMPDPAVLKMTKIDISTPGSGRDECGTMHKMIVTKKKKYEVAWHMLTPEQAAGVLSALESSAVLSCVIYDPVTGLTASGDFTAGDRDIEWQQWLTRSYDAKLFKNISCSLIEV